MRFVLAFASLAGLAGGAQAADRISGSFESGVLQSVTRDSFDGFGLATPADHLIFVSPAGQLRLASRGVGAGAPVDLTQPTAGSPGSATVGERSPLSPSDIRDSLAANAAPAEFGGARGDEQPSAVPDVTSWGLLLGGFSLVGIIARRRRDGRSVSA